MASISSTLAVPLILLSSRVRNHIEAEILWSISHLAETIDCLLRNYFSMAVESQNLQKAWDDLWLAREPYINAAIPLVGAEMSAANHSRLLILQQMRSALESLLEKVSSLARFIGVNTTLAQELKREGVQNLAADKLLLAALETEISQRIKGICSGIPPRKFSSLVEFIGTLTLNSGAADINGAQAKSSSQSPNFSSPPSDERLPGMQQTSTGRRQQNALRDLQ